MKFFVLINIAIEFVIAFLVVGMRTFVVVVIPQPWKLFIGEQSPRHCDKKHDVRTCMRLGLRTSDNNPLPDIPLPATKSNGIRPAVIGMNLRKILRALGGDDEGVAWAWAVVSC